MKTIVYLGPTLARDEAKIILDADYRPPVTHADIISAVYNEKPDIIGIIDGLLGNTLSVWHKEILDALNNGITVYGSSAIGALRAAELASFGMRGIGKVYEDFKNNRLEDDDEVMVTFKKEGDLFARTSESLVNIRAILQLAMEKGIIANAAADELISISKSIYYPRRTYSHIFQTARERGVGENVIAKLQEFISTNVIDIQKHDAIDLLIAIKNQKSTEKIIEPTPSKGRLFSVLYNRYRKVPWSDMAIPLFSIVNNFCMRSHDSDELYRNSVNKKIALMMADILRVNISEEDLNVEISRFRNKHNIIDDQYFFNWLSENDITEDDFRELMSHEARIRKLQSRFQYKYFLERNSYFILDELKLRNQYARWKEKTANIEDILTGKEQEIIDIVNRDDYSTLLQEYFDAENVPENVDLPANIQEMGFTKDEFIVELAKAKAARSALELSLEKMFLADSE